MVTDDPAEVNEIVGRRQRQRVQAKKPAGLGGDDRPQAVARKVRNDLGSDEKGKILDWTNRADKQLI